MQRIRITEARGCNRCGPQPTSGAVEGSEPRSTGCRGPSRRWVGVAGLAVLAVGTVLWIARSSDRSVRVSAGPDDGGLRATPTVAGTGFVAGVALGTRLEYQVPDRWTTLYAEGDRMALSTRALSDGDRDLALLARDDVAFGAFPSDGVVVVVGGHPLEAKYLTGRDGSTVAPGPAYALGDGRVMAAGVRVRRGDVPQSIVKIASYAGPSAPAIRLREAEAIAASVRVVRSGDPSVLPAPPPPGSRPGLPGGPLPVAEQGLPEAARAPASGSSLVLVAGSSCAYLRWVDAQPSLPGSQPLAGACASQPAGAAVAVAGPAVMVMRGPGTSPSTAVIVRAGPGVRSVTARLADGRSARVVLGNDGWGLVASDGRIVAVTAFDAAGHSAPETPVR